MSISHCSPHDDRLLTRLVPRSPLVFCVVAVWCWRKENSSNSPVNWACLVYPLVLLFSGLFLLGLELFRIPLKPFQVQGLCSLCAYCVRPCWEKGCKGIYFGMVKTDTWNAVCQTAASKTNRTHCYGFPVSCLWCTVAEYVNLKLNASARQQRPRVLSFCDSGNFRRLFPLGFWRRLEDKWHFCLWCYWDCAGTCCGKKW